VWRATWRSLLAHKIRLGLSGLAVVLGVAFVSGTMVFTDTLSRTFSDLFDATSADVTVTPKAAYEVGLTGTTGGPVATATLPQSVVDTLKRVDGATAVGGFVQTQGVYVVKADGEVLSTGGAPAIGLNWYDAPSLNPATMTSGRAPRGEGEVAFDTTTATRSGHRIGDSVTILTTGPRVEARLVGIFRFGKTGGLAGASLTAFETGTAQRLLGKVGQFDGVSLEAAPGTSHAVLKERVAAALGDGFDVKTQSEQSDDAAETLAAGLKFIDIALLVFAGVALFVGGFIILNTFAMLVAQRTRELGLLRAIGASRGQVTRSVLTEAAVLGFGGSTLGLAGGLAIAAALKALFATFGLTLDGSLVLSRSTVLWSYAVGVLVTVVAAYLPARRASHTPPLAAMQFGAATAQGSLRRRTGFGVVLAAGGSVAVALSLRTDDASTAAALVGAGTVLLVIGAIALSPVLARPFLATAGALLPKLWGRTGQLARENALRNPRRTAATASALMVGLALVSGFSIVGASTNASLDKLIEGGLRADFVISTAVGQPFTPAVADEVARVPGVEAVMQQRFSSDLVEGSQAFVTAVDADALERSIALDYLAGSAAALGGTTALVDEPSATEHRWQVGDPVEALLPNGSRLSLTVGGIYAANQVVGKLVVDLPTYDAAGAPKLDQYVYVTLAPGVDATAVRAAMQTVVDAYPVVTLKDQGEFKDEIKGQVDQLLLLVNALLALSVLIAVLGIINTLALAVIERTREIGLLRAVGMSRAQVRRMIRLEAVVVSLYGAALGLVLGTVFGVGLAHALAGQGIDVLAVPYARLLEFLVVAGLIGVLAALWPARRAARLQVLTAIATT
jgi:putative ABC transport system permease protein